MQVHPIHRKPEAIDATDERKPQTISKKSGKATEGAKRFPAFQLEKTKDGQLRLERNHPHYFQVQLYMKCMKASWWDYCLKGDTSFEKE